VTRKVGVFVRFRAPLHLPFLTHTLHRPVKVGAIV
jgi:hypothetical protein